MGEPPVHFSHSIIPFSGLNYDYRDKWEEELAVCIKIGIGYFEFMSMPVILRRGILEKFKRFSKPNSTSDDTVISKSKGKRSRRISGDALANKMKSGEINPLGKNFT